MTTLDEYIAEQMKDGEFAYALEEANERVDTPVEVILYSNDGGMVTWEDGTVEQFDGVTEAAFEVLGLLEFPDGEQVYTPDDPSHRLNVKRGWRDMLTADTDWELE